MNQTYKRRETDFFYLDETANKFDESVIEGGGSRTGRMGGIENFYENKPILFCFFPLPGFTRETILLHLWGVEERKILGSSPSRICGTSREETFSFHSTFTIFVL
jgi:hypothetical protein